MTQSNVCYPYVVPHCGTPHHFDSKSLKNHLNSFMFYRISQHSTFLYLMNLKFTIVGIIEDQLIDSIYPAGTIYQKLGHRDGAFFSDSKMRTSFHPRLQQCLDGISVQERYFQIFKGYSRMLQRGYTPCCSECQANPKFARSSLGLLKYLMHIMHATCSICQCLTEIFNHSFELQSIKKSEDLL